MVIVSKTSLDQFSPIKSCKAGAGTNTNNFSSSCSNVPVIDLLNPESKTLLVKACEEFGFFKVVNHGVPIDIISRLETEALNFFSLPQSDKEKSGPANPFGYGNKRIGPNGDVGWVEYLLLNTSPPQSISQNPNLTSSALSEYLSYVRKLGSGILEILADGLKIEERNMFSKLLMDEQSDSVFRLNHYPPCPEGNKSVIGFGEHTDPQIISILRSNDTCGLQICLKDGSWVSVPADRNSFFIIVGDSMQVMSNGRMRSVKHRVITNSSKSRISMIYFGAPPPNERIKPIRSIMSEGEESLYKEFTWCEFKKSAYMTRLADNRIAHFQKCLTPSPSPSLITSEVSLTH